MIDGTVVVEVPATSANLGPGFDSLGVALDLVDRIEAGFTDGDGVHVEVWGEGEGRVPTDGTNLVARVLRTGLAAFDQSGELARRGLVVRCTNAVPHGRGLGSSAAAIVGGLLSAVHLAGMADEVSPRELVALATRLEGHPDNVAASVLGGATIAWMSDGELGPVGRATRFEVLDDITPVLAIPEVEASTTRARGVLPATVAHADAAFNAARSALLVRALSAEPGLLLAATDDRLHQRQRGAVYPASLELVEALRAKGVAAAISGAGPSVIAFAVDDAQATRDLVADLAGSPWQVRAIPVARIGARAVSTGAPVA